MSNYGLMRLGRKGVDFDLQLGQIRKLWEACQELGYLEVCRLDIPRGQIRGLYGTAKDVGHRVVGRMVIGACGVDGPAYGVAVGLVWR